MDKRVKFDFQIEFTNGGGIQGQDFRLDLVGDDISDQELADYIVQDMRLLMVGEVRILNKEIFKEKEVRNRAILVHTGWDAHWNTAAYFENHPFLTEDAAVYLQKCGVKLVGIDAMNIDNTQGKSRPVHSTLLASDILIVEHLCNWGELPDAGFTFSAVPPKFKGVGTFPVRAIAKLK